MSQSLVVVMGITPMPKQVPIALEQLQPDLLNGRRTCSSEKVQRLIAEKYDRKLIYMVEFLV